MIKEILYSSLEGCKIAPFIIELLKLTLQNNLLEFMGETFVQIFGIPMGTNTAPIIANLYLANLEKKLKEQTKSDFNMIWPSLWKRYIDDGFGVIKGVKKDVDYFVSKFNSMVNSIKIDKVDFGDRVEFLDLVICKGTRFCASGLFDISLFQKEVNIYAYIPLKSLHPEHTIINFILGELKRYVKCNSEELAFVKNKKNFFLRLRARGYDKLFLKKQFDKVSYKSRSDLLKLPISNLCQNDQQNLSEDLGGVVEGEGLNQTISKAKANKKDIHLIIDGDFLALKPYLQRSVQYEMIKHVAQDSLLYNFFKHHNIVITFTKCANLGNMIVKTKL
jgi:hypothetical protein